jgi:hypothetical protein
MDYSTLTDLNIQKLTKKEYLKMSGIKEEDPTDGGEDGERASREKGDGEGTGTGTGDGGKKTKVPNLYRQLKGRLQKLIDKTDEECVRCIFTSSTH